MKSILWPILVTFLITNVFAVEVKKCSETKAPIHQEFISINFEIERNSVGKDQLEPVKESLMRFLNSHPQVIISEIAIIASSPKLPTYKEVLDPKKKKKKKVIDTDGNEYNLKILNQRVYFADLMMIELKKKNARITKYKVLTDLAGPEFENRDLNLRFVTPASSHYNQQVEDLFKKHEKDYREKIFLFSATDLKNQKNGNLFLDKFKLIKPKHRRYIQFIY